MPVTGSFIPYRLARLRPPLNGPQGETWANVLGGQQDDELALLRVAALSRFPATCPDDGLDLLGQAFALERYPGEGNDAYRARLAGAWAAYQIAGSAQAIINSLKASGYPIVDVTPVWTLAVAPETSNTSYSEFYIILTFVGPSYGPIYPMILGSFTLGDATSAGLLGSSLTASQLAAIKRQILRWKAAHGYPIKLILVFPATSTANRYPTSASCQYPIGRTLGDTWPSLGNAGCILGGYIL